MKNNNVWTSIIVFGFLAMVVVGCNNYDKESILGTWQIDIKEAKNLSSVDSAKETMYFSSGSDQTYKQAYEERTSSKWERWTVTGKYERKNNKITFTDRIKDDDNKQGDVTYKYKIDGNKLTFIVEGEGFQNDEKIYTKK